MKKAYLKPAAEKVEFNYSDNVIASLGGNTIQDGEYTWTYTNITGDANSTYQDCRSSFKEAEGMTCGYNGKHTGNPGAGLCNNNP